MSDEDTPETCFGCGLDNPRGLQLSPLMQIEDDELAISTQIGSEFAGFAGLVHGGVSATLLDEAMSAWCSRVLKVRAVTGEISVRFLHPFPTETTVEARARGKRQGRKILCSGEIRDSTGQVLVEGSGTWIVMSETLEE